MANYVELKKEEIRSKKSAAMFCKNKLMGIWKDVFDVDRIINDKIQDHSLSVKINGILKWIDVALDDVLMDETFYSKMIYDTVVEHNEAKSKIFEYLKTVPNFDIAQSEMKDGAPLTLSAKVSNSLGLHIDIVIWAFNELEKENRLKIENGKVICREE